MVDFPTFTKGAADSKTFKSESADPALRTEKEDGYTITRARYTRAPRKTFTITYRFLDEADRATLESFWDSMRGGSAIFRWRHPITLAWHNVRFKDSLKLVFTGVGAWNSWDVTLQFEEV